MSTEIKKAQPKYFYGSKGTSTPWGRADTAYHLARGVVWYGTPSHGGLSVTVKWARDNLTLAAQYLAMIWGGKLWFEEDCDCSLVFHEHPDLWTRLTGQPEPSHPFSDSSYGWNPSYFDADFDVQCRTAGALPDLLTLQPGDTIRLSGSLRAFRVSQDWYPRGKARHRRIVAHGQETGGNNYRLTDADVLGRLVSIEREGSVVWERPMEPPREAKRAEG